LKDCNVAHDKFNDCALKGLSGKHENLTGQRDEGVEEEIQGQDPLEVVQRQQEESERLARESEGKNPVDPSPSDDRSATIEEIHHEEAMNPDLKAGERGVALDPAPVVDHPPPYELKEEGLEAVRGGKVV
jgi:hypothetical protein